MALTLNNDINTLKVGDYFWCYFNGIDRNFNYIYNNNSGDNAQLFRFNLSDFAIKTDAEVTGELLDGVTWNAETAGYFRFIVVDVKPNGEVVCIADRNIAYYSSFRNYDSYDGMMQIGCGLELLTKKPMSANRAVGGTPMASSQYSTSTIPANAFDKNYSTYWQPNKVASDVNFNQEWIGYQFTQPVLIKYVGFTSNYYMMYYGIPYLYLEYSDDGVNWFTLSTFDVNKAGINVTGTDYLQMHEFDYTHTQKHLYWRIRFEKGTAGYYPALYSVLMYEAKVANLSLFNDFNVKISAPTSNAKINERIIDIDDWDKYINSDLGGLIDSVGDNNIWNLKYPSYTSSLGHEVNNSVVARGGNNGDVNYHNKLSATIQYGNNMTTGAGFRPKLTLKRKDFADSKIFFNNGGQFKTYEVGQEAVFKSTPLLPEFVNDGSTLSSTQNGYSISVNTGTDVWKLLNRNSGSWFSSDDVTKAEIIIDFGVSNDKRVGGYVIEYKLGGRGYSYGNAYQDQYCAPKTWEVYGSTYGDTTGSDPVWVLVDKRHNVKFQEGELKNFYFDSPHIFRFFKFVIYANNADPKNLAINYINLYDTQSDKVKPYWQSLSTTMPSQSTIKSEGLNDLSVLDRKTKKFTENMVNNGAFGAGNIYKGKIKLSTQKNISGIKLM